MTAPKTVVLPLHHGPIIVIASANLELYLAYANFLTAFFSKKLIYFQNRNKKQPKQLICKKLKTTSDFL